MRNRFIKSISKYLRHLTLRRVVLVFLCTAITFSATMPNQVMAFQLFDLSNKPKIQSILPAPAVDYSSNQRLAAATSGGGTTNPQAKVDHTHDHEDATKRTPFTSTYVNKDGTKSLEYSVAQQNYKDATNTWQKINNTLNAVEKSAPAANLWQILTNNVPKADPPSEFNGKAGLVEAKMKPLSDGLDIIANDKTITIKPVGAKNVTPERKDDRTVIYKDAWPNVDLEYELRGETVKEIIVLKNKNAQTNFGYTVTGGKVINHPTHAGELTIEGMPSEFGFSALTLDVNEKGIMSNPLLSQVPTEDGISVVLDKDWMLAQPTSSFPMKIDPSFGRDATSYWMFKSDGYSCGSSNCYANIGTINDNSGYWRDWRTYFQFPFSDMAGKKVISATLHGYFQYGQNGITDGRYIDMGHAPCIGFNCQGAAVGQSLVGTDFDIDFSGALQTSINNNDWGTVWSLWGEEGAYKSFKPYYDLRANVVYDSPTSQATPITPADKQVTVTTQPTLKVNPATDADGDAIQYYFRVSTTADAETGAVINSGWTSATQWTVPDGILQDGTTYYWHVYTRGATQTNPNWIQSFKVDLRTGKDSTQAYDTVGPMGIDLATGNTTTSASTHSMSALGGTIGLALNYNTPAKAKRGLTAQYWNVATNYAFASGVPTTTPALTRNEQDINNNWNTDSPAPGVVNSDWFFANWKGYFVAPSTGSYQFGGSNDDAMSINVNGQDFGSGCYGSAPCYNGSTISLTAGQAVPITVNYEEATSTAYAKVYVKGAVTEQTINPDWLRTDAVASQSQYGLTGRYYTDDGSHNFPTDNSDPMRLMMVRQDTNLSFNWGMGGPAPGLQSTNFMTRWTGYITVPTTGTYTLGATADDGVRISLNNGFMGAQQTVLNSWQDQGGPTLWGTATTLTAGQAVPITVDYYQHTGGAQMSLLAQGPGLSTTGDQTMPIKWLTPKASALPDAWQLGVDVDGNVGYERLRVAGNSIILEDSTRATHEYTWTGTGYKPPVNEDGQLTRNANNTYTFINTDGRTYVFDAEGKLTSLTSATDDQHPASLKYTYSGDPSRLMTITDGVTNTRYGSLYYKSVNDDSTICPVPSSYDTVPDGMLCAFKTSDGNITRFDYKAGQLSRIEKPGGEDADYGYDSLGRIISTRDSLANDAIAAGVRTDDNNLMTEMSYDSIGRVSGITAPAPTSGANRTNTTFEFLPSATQMHITGATEPNGFSKRVDYDSLLRTTKETDIANLATQTSWDPVKDLELSKTDVAGLMSTIIYDDDDRAVANYGPAPSAWYDATTRLPLSAYASQVPKSTTNYDEGMSGLAVAYLTSNAATGVVASLAGAPLLHTTNIATDGTISKNFGTMSPIPNQTGSWGVTMTGKMRLPTTGNWNFRAYSDNGVRVWVDDQLVLDDWTNGVARSHSAFTYNNAVASSMHRVRIDYYSVAGSSAIFSLYATPPGGSETINTAQYFSPDYSLKTSGTTYDTQLGNTSTSTTYSKPEYGLMDKAIQDPTGLNLQTASTYETPGTGFLRQTSSALPGGVTTTYSHYGASDTRDNPCTTAVESFHQAGRPMTTTEPSPDGGTTTGRTSTAIYDESGNVVATRYNSDPWTCTSYDARGRVTQVVIPSINGAPARTITHNYAVGGNPFVTSSTDSTGTITTTSDLLGRTVSYSDIFGDWTGYGYDDLGRHVRTYGDMGEQSFTYDNYNRLTSQSFGGNVVATPRYDTYGRLSSVDYPTAAQQKLNAVTYDSSGSTSGLSYTLGNGSTTLSDAVTRSQSGQIISGTENGQAKSYSYDKAGRLTAATIGADQYAYNYVQGYGCPGVANPNSYMDSNRTNTTHTVGGITTTTTGCYNYADQLTYSNDPNIDTPVYDSHGNIVHLGTDTGGKVTQLYYDSSDRNTGIRQNWGNDYDVAYNRDVANRIVSRFETGLHTASTWYGFTGTGDTPDFARDANWNITEKYLDLPGGVILTMRPTQTGAAASTFSLPNIHGDVMATTDATGTSTGAFKYDPFGQVIGTGTPTNINGNMTYSWEGQHSKDSESDFALSPIQMGARVYIPNLGRFTSVDPVQGGNENAYVYPPDPVNKSDLTGRCPSCILVLGVFLAAVVIAQASREYRQNPTTWNFINAGASMIPGLSGATRGAATTLKSSWGPLIRNGNNVLRAGGGRISIGAAPGIFRALPIWQKLMNPIHIHMELSKGGIQFNWFKNIAGRIRSMRLWGSWGQ